MRHFIFLILTLITLSCSAQRTVVDTTKYAFHYAIKYSTSEELSSDDDELVVEIGKERTHCYGYWSEVNALAYDSIIAHGGNVADYLGLGNPIATYRDNIIKNYPKKGELTFTCYLGKNFIYTEPIKEKKWILEEGDTTILDYPCKKASCTFRNRTWQVWYTLDIPFSEGPWKLDGLPGMILKAEDTQNKFSAECIGIRQNLNKPMSAKLTKRVRITPIYLERLKKLEKRNYDAYEKAVGITNVLSRPKYDSRTACLLEYYEPNRK